MYLHAFNESSKPTLIDQPRYRLLVSRLQEAGPRPVGEFIAELVRMRPELPVMDLLERYARIDAAAIRQLGADKWPVSLFAVGNVGRGTARQVEIMRATLQPSDGGDAA